MVGLFYNYYHLVQILLFSYFIILGDVQDYASQPLAFNIYYA